MVHRSSSHMSDRTSDVAAWHFQIESACSLHWPESVLFETVEQSECESSISKCSFEHVYLIAETHSVGKKTRRKTGLSLKKSGSFDWPLLWCVSWHRITSVRITWATAKWTKKKEKERYHHLTIQYQWWAFLKCNDDSFDLDTGFV